MKMNQVKELIQIVQYHEGWAKGIAKMWNLSRDGWGGDTRVMTEDQVKTKEANSDNIELYLAVDGDEVVGYCGLSEYKEDTESLYIPLLNVHPDYHGQKIGKKLVLRALEKTIELGWPRLDLYTWPGNTKAVPLYKKCGFFWEDRDDTTHLMNFIPQVLNTPLLKPIFTDLDWYDSSVRKIEVKPDGTKENGFTFYEYSWRNENKFARVQFERTGRGINLIETDEFILMLQLTEHEVIEQEQQNYQIKFVNKTNVPMSLKVSGSGHDRVEYSLNAEMIVHDEAIISETLTVKKGEEPSVWRTHPYLSVNVSVDDKECELRLGIFPLQPAKIETSYSGNLSYLTNESSIELEIKNNLKEDAEFSLLFPENELVSLKENNHTVFIPKSERRSLSIPLVIREYGFYKPTLHISAKKTDGTELKFEQEISAAFKGLGEKFGGESKDYWHIFNGLSQVNIRKRDLLITAAKNGNKKQPLVFFPPMLGKPYSNEFTKKKPKMVSWESKNSSILLNIVLESDEMKGLHLTQNIQLFGDGIVHKWIEIENRGSEEHNDVAISSPMYHELSKTYFPLEDKVIYFSENRLLEFGDIKPGTITGNWYFSENNPEPIGFSWSRNSKATPDGWRFIIEDELGSIEPGVKKSSEKVTISIGAFLQWEDFRAFSTQASVIEKSEVSSESAFTFENNILSSDTDLSITLNTYRNNYLDGQLQVFVNEKELYEEQIHADEEKTSYSLNFPVANLEPLSILKSEFRSNSMTTKLEELILSPTDSNVSIHSRNDESFDTFEANNGCISIKAAPNFYPGIFSIHVNGSEWLDHSFPKLTAKSWWNPWAGGMKTAPSGLNTFSLMKENHSAFQVEKLDLQGNSWNGLAIQTDIHEHPQWKGVQYVQYYLMLPGVPVIATYLEVKELGGKNLKHEIWNTDFFVGGENLSNVFVEMLGSQQTKHYKAGLQEIPISLETGSFISSLSKSEKLYVVPSLYSDNSEAYTNKEALQVLFSQTSIPCNQGCKTAPLFMIFDHRDLSADLLQKIRKVQF
jgi:ribosomal protein S18 acetylase RimI-like enzyme